MDKKHGELKIMTAKEMVDMFYKGKVQTGMDFATLDFAKESLHGIPLKYLDVEKVYEDAWGWNGIRVMDSPFDWGETIVSVGHYGSSISDVFSIYAENIDYDTYGIRERIRNAIMNADYGVIKDDTLLIVEMHDEVYKRAEEDRKCEQIIAEQKRKMVV